MRNYKQTKIIFEKILIKKPYLIAVKLHYDSPILQNIPFESKINTNLIGGSKKINVLFKSIDYVFHVYREDEYIYYNLHQLFNEDKYLCVLIIIDKINKHCEIHSITYDDKCFGDVQIGMNKKTGSDLFKLALYLISKLKDRYNLDYIQLTDNSTKRCTDKTQIELGKMYTLLHGTTWYGKYGFIPKDQTNIEDFYINHKIIKNTFLKDIPELKKYILDAYELNKSTYDKIFNIKTIISSYEASLKDNYLLKDFLKGFLTEFESSCMIFYDFYKILYKKLGLYDFQNKTFIKILNPDFDITQI